MDRLLTGGNVFRGGRFERADLGIRDGRFCDPADVRGAPRVELHGAQVIPGLVDIHIHGCVGADVSDADEAGLRRMAAYLLRRGVTTFSPATMTLDPPAIMRAFNVVKTVMAHPLPGEARVAGVYMEGPFFSEKKKGAQNEKYLRKPDAALIARLTEEYGDVLRVVCVAPELEGAPDFIRTVAPLRRVSVAHTDADYETARRAFCDGASHVTHLFNAMPALLHRAPGVIGAAAENAAVTAELICDGIHVHPSAVRAAFALFPGRICLVSDALRCCGMPDGEYTLGGQRVHLNGARATLDDGTIAGSASDLAADLRAAIRFGIPREEAILAATLRPAQVIGMDDRIGSIENGKIADLLILDENGETKEIFAAGEPVGHG